MTWYDITLKHIYIYISFNQILRVVLVEDLEV